MNELIPFALMIPIVLTVLVVFGFIYATYRDFRNPPKPIHYIWRHVWPDYKGEWQKGRVTSVYLRQDTNDIRGKVVGQSDGLYLATMWNGSSKEFMFEYEATKWVEEYKARVYK